ncbi:MAG: D-alanine--D-alanine ligase [Spirochaetota bacterium]|nr:D-alanine--D-alanine ligase [Spirochaetota bacterium]
MIITRVGILFGGRSGEHEVSIRSAESVLKAIDRSKYLPIPVAIRKDGSIASEKQTVDMLSSELKSLLESDIQSSVASTGSDESAIVVSTLGLTTSHTDRPGKRFDVIFPVLHGPNGEDGTIQGLLELMDIPYVGSGVLGSSTGMDKEIMKRILLSHGLPLLPFVSFKKHEWDRDQEKIIHNIESETGYPAFVKPANMGSSVGITKAHSRDELLKGIELALSYDRKVVVEKGINAREIEIAILGNDLPEASVAGEVIPCNEFYDYEAKYLVDNSELIIPAAITPSEHDLIKNYAIKAFVSLDCAGFARADFFIDKDSGKIYFNELNTIPGFTSKSLYPRLWEASGLAYGDLIHRLIELAFERHREKGDSFN